MNPFKILLILNLAILPLTSSYGQEKTYKETSNWVTEYLANGGRLQNITGLKRPWNWKRNARFENIAIKTDLPKEWNWNDFVAGGLQPIRNQGSCGSCWAFSVIAVLESLLKINNPEVVPDLAEQTLVSSCSSAGSCSGGYFSAFNYLQSPGVPDEAQDPYKAVNTRCKSGLIPKAKVAYWAYLGDRNATSTIEQMKTAIMTYGPISVDVNGSFGSYGSGIYNRCNSSSTNHMVTIEGWKDDPTFERNGGGYWIMRNSWGSNWGEKGYMRIVYKGTNGRKCNNIGQVSAFAVLAN